MNLQAKGGGYKITKASSNRMYFKGKTGSRTVAINFDLKAPTHCKSKSNCIKSDYLPVDVGRQIDSNVSGISNVYDDRISVQRYYQTNFTYINRSRRYCVAFCYILEV